MSSYNSAPSMFEQPHHQHTDTICIHDEDDNGKHFSKKPEQQQLIVPISLKDTASMVIKKEDAPCFVMPQQQPLYTSSLSPSTLSPVSRPRSIAKNEDAPVQKIYQMDGSNFKGTFLFEDQYLVEIISSNMDEVNAAINNDNIASTAAETVEEASRASETIVTPAVIEELCLDFNSYQPQDTNSIPSVAALLPVTSSPVTLLPSSPPSPSSPTPSTTITTTISSSPPPLSSSLSSQQQYIPIAKKTISISNTPNVSSSLSSDGVEDAAENTTDDDDDDDEELPEGQHEVDAEEMRLQKYFPLTDCWDDVIPQTRSVHLSFQSKSKRELSYSIYKKKCNNLNEAELNFVKEIHYYVPKCDSVFMMNIDKLDNKIADRSYYFENQTNFMEDILTQAHKSWGDECSTFVIPSLESIAKSNTHLKGLIFNGSADTIENEYLFTFEKYTKDYAKNMAALQMSFPRCKEFSTVTIAIQDIIVGVQESVRSTLPHIPKLRFYQSNNYNVSSLALSSMHSEEFAKTTNSITDLTVFTYNFNSIDSYFYPMIESFFIHIMMSSTRSKTCDLLFGEWVLILREYWRLCTNDLKDYNENIPRPTEKKLLCILLKQIKKRIRSKQCNDFKVMCIHQLIKLLNLNERKYISKQCLEYLKYYFSVLTDDCHMAKSRHKNDGEEMLWAFFFRKLNLHHSNLYYTFMTVMQKREKLLLEMFNARRLFQDITQETELKVKVVDKFWTKNIKFQQFLARNIEYLNSETQIEGENMRVFVQKFFNNSQFYQMTNRHIPKIIVNDILNYIFDDAEAVSDRLVYLMEYVYQFFIDFLAEYLVNVYGMNMYGFAPLSNIKVTYNSMIQFFQQGLSKIRIALGYRECLQNIAICYKLRMLVLRSIKNTIACKSQKFKDLPNMPEFEFSEDFLTAFFGYINLGISYAVDPLFALYERDSMDAYAWNKCLCASFKDLQDLIFKTHDIMDLQVWMLESMINPIYNPCQEQDIEKSKAIWKSMNYYGVADVAIPEDLIKSFNDNDNDDEEEEEEMAAEVQ